MEDISRELEREIAQIKPAPHKLRRENAILIVNDFGEIRSGAFLKVLVCFFAGRQPDWGTGYACILSPLCHSEQSKKSIDKYPGRI